MVCMVMWRNAAKDYSQFARLEDHVGHEVPITWKTFMEAIKDAHLEELTNNKLIKLSVNHS